MRDTAPGTWPTISSATGVACKHVPLLGELDQHLVQSCRRAGRNIKGQLGLKRHHPRDRLKAGHNSGRQLAGNQADDGV